MRRTLQILMISIVMFASNSHLAVLQVVAWTGMLVENVQGLALEEAIARTFDGQHPCSLCHAIEGVSQIASEGADREPPRPSIYVLELKLLPLDRVALFPPNAQLLPLSGADQRCEMRVLQPVVPPPRTVWGPRFRIASIG
mgnify:CR=1 FL=1